MSKTQPKRTAKAGYIQLVFDLDQDERESDTHIMRPERRAELFVAAGREVSDADRRRWAIEAYAEARRRAMKLDSTAHKMFTEKITTAGALQGIDSIAAWARSKTSEKLSHVADGDVNNLTGESRALAVLAEHPDWANKQIAEKAGVHEKSLSRWPRFKAARRACKSARDDRPIGRRDMRTGNLEPEASTKCRHCKDDVTPWTCDHCDAIITDQCRDCHAEVTRK
jgi:hypothetical protein